MKSWVQRGEAMAELRLVSKDSSEEQVSGMTNIQKMQLAVQIAALVRASFVQPTDSDVRDLLQMAASQLSLPCVHAG